MSATTATRTPTDPRVTRLLIIWQQSLPGFTTAGLRHEEQRTELFPPSPAAVFMHQAIDAEWRRRGGAR